MRPRQSGRLLWWALGVIGVIAVAVVIYPISLPWDASPRTKLNLLSLPVADFERRLASLCKSGQLLPTIAQKETDIPGEASVKGNQIIRFLVTVSVPRTNEVVLEVTLPQINSDGPFSLWSTEALKAGARLVRKGRCETGELTWQPGESTVPDRYLPERWARR
jgi:hypothetical protein